MKTVCNYGLENQSTSFGISTKKPVIKYIKISGNRITSDAEKARESRIKSFKELIGKNPDIANIVNEVNSGKLTKEDAANRILDTIA